MILENTKLYQSMTLDLSPKDRYEKFSVISTGFKSNTTLHDMLVFFSKYKEEGYVIEFLRVENGSQLINLKKERNNSEIIAYRIQKVENQILRWMSDGIIRQQKILGTKEPHVLKYIKKCEDVRSKTGSLPKEMEESLNKKIERLQYYKTKTDEMKDIVKNYTNYTYEELCSFPNQYFKTGGRLK